MYFTKYGTWYGGFYELAIELGEPSDERLLDALKALWQHPSLEGCYLDSDKEPNEQKRVTPSKELLDRMHVYGLALLPDGHRVACGSCLIREDDGSDWLDFYLPTGALSDAYEIGGYPYDYPFDEADVAHREWQIPVDEWLKSIGEYVYSIVPYRLALIGFEVSGEAYASEIAEKGVPAERYIGYLWAEGSSLEWYPPNM
jgi:hypothetical protein